MNALYRDPVYMIRRAHQIATAIFSETCEELALTQAQFTVMFVLQHRGPLGQNEVGRLVSLDRATTSLVARVLHRRRLISRTANPDDRRMTLLALTEPGKQLLAKAERLRIKASREFLAGFSVTQSKHFIDLLATLTTPAEEE